LETKSISLISDCQRKYIFRLQKELAIEIEDLREIAYDISGAASISRLSMTNASKLIERLVGRNKTPERKAPKRKTPKRRPQGKNVVYLISDYQKRYIMGLARELKWDCERLKGFYQRQIKKDKPGTSREASSVITGLKEIIKGNYGHDRRKNERV